MLRPPAKRSSVTAQVSVAPAKMSPAQEFNTCGGLLSANTVANNLQSASAKQIRQNRIFEGSEMTENHMTADFTRP